MKTKEPRNILSCLLSSDCIKLFYYNGKETNIALVSLTFFFKQYNCNYIYTLHLNYYYSLLLLLLFTMAP